MTGYVVDASVGIKWFIPEVHNEAARRLLGRDGALHVPELFALEVSGVLCKLVRRGELTHREARVIQQELARVPVQRHANDGILPAAFDLALQLRHSLYDCMYLALAVLLDAQLVTADRKLVEVLSSTACGHFLCWVEDLPVSPDRKD